jgi:hypothetical protein
LTVWNAALKFVKDLPIDKAKREVQRINTDEGDKRDK